MNRVINMKSKHYEKVKTFMEKAGQEINTVPTEPSEETRQLRAALIIEEALETIHAMGIEVTFNDEKELTIDALDYWDTEKYKVDIEQVADGCADLRVVTTGTLISFGINDEELQDEVDASNLRKFAVGHTTRKDGKHIKPPNWEAPDIKKILAKQVLIYKILPEITNVPLTWSRIWQRIGEPDAPLFTECLETLVSSKLILTVGGRSAGAMDQVYYREGKYTFSK